MICPNCQTPNRPFASFCKECGRFLLPDCARCGAQLPEKAKFCDICGHSLFAPLPLEKVNIPPEAARSGAPETSGAGMADAATAGTATPPQLRQYIPQELLDKLEAAGAAATMAGERRLVTMLFCDLKGSTAAAERLDPEEWAEIVNGAFEHMIAPVYRYEGTVARLMGDGILAFFGAPIAHEDDPLRAILTGLDIVSGLRAYSISIFRRYGFDLNARVGINTGRVVVGAVGSDLRLEYTALGDAINIAARMEQAAQPGTVQVAEDTYRLVTHRFEFEDLGPVAVKGKVEPLQAYRVLGRKIEPAQAGSVAGLEAPLVGRAEERLVLQEALGDLQHGRGRIILLIGQAGLGKSRLIWELEREQDPGFSTAGLQFLVYRQTASYRTAEAYGLLKGLLRLACKITEDASPSEIRATLALLPAHVQSAAVANLMGLGEDAVPAPSGEVVKRQLFTSCLALFSHLASDTPLALVLDDLQWADSASVELIQHLFQMADSAPLLFLCAMRPDREAASWGLKTAAETDYPHRYTEIVLQPLAQEESNRLLDGLLTGANLPLGLRSLILDKSEGNPLFIEEVVRTLIDDGVVKKAAGDGSWQVAEKVDDIAVPGNLQALLASRIDRLSEEARRVLQLASVIGRMFQYRVLERIGATEKQLAASLTALQRAELILETARLPERIYLFRSTLMAETVYRSILRKQRRDYHRQVAEAILALYAERLDDYIPALAHHFYRAADNRAVAYCIQAGDEAARLYANAEAATYYDWALKSAKNGDKLTGELISYLYHQRGRVLELNSRFAEALANYEEMERLAQERGDRSVELESMLLQGTVYATANENFDAGMAEELAARGLDLASSLGDTAAEARIQWNLLNAYRLTQRLDQALVAGERSLALARELDLKEQLAFTANDLTHVYTESGQPDKGLETAAEASRLWRELDNRPMLADSLASAGLVTALLGDFETTIALSEESLQISRSIENLWGQSYSQFMVGLVYWEQGRPEKALAAMEDCLRLGEEAGFMPARLWIGPQLALAYARLGQFERAIYLAGKAKALAETSMALYEQVTQAVEGEILIYTGQLERATPIFARLKTNSPQHHPFFGAFVELARCRFALARHDQESAIEIAAGLVGALRRFSAHMLMPTALGLQGRAHLQAGSLAVARQSLLQAKAEAETMAAYWPLWLCQATLAEVETQEGNLEEAARLRSAAREIVEKIAGRLDKPEIRASFLETAAVRALIDIA